MPLNQSPVRSDFAFLSRRTKPASREAAPLDLSRSRPNRTTAQAPAAVSLRREPAPVRAGAVRPAVGIRTPRPAQPEPTSFLFPAPSARTLRELTPSTPLVRLNSRQSAVGSLRVAGAGAIAWEGSDRVTGARTLDGHVAGTHIMTAGNRPLLDYVDGDAVVTLRHIHQLRRALFIGRGRGPIVVRLYDGTAVAVPAKSEDCTNILLLARIGNVVELRVDPLPPGLTDLAVWQEFGFRMTTAIGESQHFSLRQTTTGD